MATSRKVFWLVSTKAKGLRFRIMKLDKENMRATLLGDTGVPFETSVAQDQLDQLGYTLQVTEELGDAPVHSQPETA